MKLVPALLALALLASRAEAYWVSLGDRDVQEALAHGRATYQRLSGQGRPIDEADPEYVVDLGREVGRAILFTAFSAVALESRRWLAIGRELRGDDLERVLAPLQGRLQFLVTLTGPSRDFLRSWAVRLEQRGTALGPVESDVYRGTPQPGVPDRWVAPAIFTFSSKDLDPAAPVTLVLRAPDGTDVRFEFDLSRLR